MTATNPFGPGGMTEAQTDAWEEINNGWGIDTTGLLPDGTVSFTADDGDEGIIETDGTWRWGV